MVNSSVYRSLLAAALLGGLTFVSPAFGQPGGGTGERAQPPQRAERPVRPERASAADRSAAQAEVENWVRTLVRGLGHSNPVIQRSAAEAIIAVGRPAESILREMVAGPDEAISARARRVLAQIERAGSDRLALPLAEILSGFNLTEAQQAEVQRIARVHQARSRELMQSVRDGDVEAAEARQTRQRLQEALVGELRAVLTEEQTEQVIGAINRRNVGAGTPARGERPGAGRDRQTIREQGRRSDRPGPRSDADRP